MSQGPRAGRPRRGVSWLGLAAVIGGLALIWLYFDHPRLSQNPNPLIAVIYVGTGCILIAWGARALIAQVAAAALRGRHVPQQYRTRMPPEALVYGLILLVLCAGALLGHSNMLMLVFGLTAGPFVLNGQMTVGVLRGSRVTRRLPAHAAAGQKFSVSLRLANRKRLLSSWMVVVEDAVQAPGDEMRPGALFTRVPAQSEREAAYEIRPARRGIYEFGPVRVLSRFPLGLMERSFELDIVEQLIVSPRIGRLKPGWRQQAAERGQAAADQARARLGASDDEFHRLREYRSGDNPRAIHWRTTARRNELMVREFRPNLRRDVLLVVDLWLPARAGADELERVELAVSFAASICVDHMQSATDSMIELVISGRETERAAASSGVASMGALLERLALAEAGPADGLGRAIREAAAGAPGPLRTVLITTRPRAALEQVFTARSDAHERFEATDAEIIQADPHELAAWLEFDLMESGGAR